MKKVFFFLTFLMISNVIFASEIDIKEVRTLYYASVQNKNALNQLSELVKKDQNKALFLAYKGMSNFLMAKHAYNPFNKFKYFNKGKQELEQAIVKDPKNIEIHFLRFCAQTNIPFFLGYHQQIEVDKKIIFNQWALLEDEDLKQKIKSYMVQSKECTKSEKLIFK